jgi:glucose-1-phosphatase
MASDDRTPAAPPKPRRPALIFDFGNVVSFFDYARAGERLGKPLGLTGDAFLARARSAGLSPLVARYESGRMSAEEFGQQLCRAVGLVLTHDEFAAAWTDIFWLNEPVARLVAQLKRQGYTVVMGSNTNALHADHFRKQFAEALAPFDQLVLSYQVGHIKPEAAFYLACATATGAPPHECVFIDDLPENVEGARNAGLLAIHYRDDESLLAELRSIGVEVDGMGDGFGDGFGERGASAP